MTSSKNDGLHILPPPRPDDLPEVPTKALGQILSRPISSIREEQEEIKSRRSHAALFAAVGRSPHPRRSKKPIHLRTPSAPGSSDGFEVKQPTPQLRTSMMRDEHTGEMVTVVRGDDDDSEDSRRSREQPATGLDGNWRDPRRQADRVLHTQNNVTIITLGDDSVI
ncbi:hypothetical protein TELCIR_01232 [Teladorsagia circumcincta]|uniref:Uncharacterized protein n=1 Tax=Teladorsagia circumcincta TaxID=45464 RepID=A0A2G9V2F9_TELCI|nr:hypothetical protein TELCIR_01232 [Teladorsagia circumcincta]